MDQSFEQTYTNNDEGHSARSRATVDISVLIAYLQQLLQVLLGASLDDLTHSIFSDVSDTPSRLTAFATDPSPTVLFIVKEDVPEIEGTREGARFVYAIRPDLSPSPSLISSIAIIKRHSPLDFMLPIDSQLQILNLPNATANSSLPDREGDVSPYEMLYSLVHLAIGPYFDAYTRGKESTGTTQAVLAKEPDSKTGIPAAKKRLTELELSLLHLQQNVEIPHLSLSLHPVILQALDKAARMNTTPTIDMIPIELLSDTKFLNALQSNVNSWIKSIQAITKLTRDPAHGTATQEINFWISLEAVLEDVERQLQLDGVNLTMDVLRHAKRFHATMSFMTDTGLKESLDLVKKYNLLMNEFPIDDLLSASTLQRLKDSIVQIFNHLTKKIRISPYPIRRALPLVEAISVDLDNQFRSLLSGRRLMHFEYSEFQRVVAVAEDVFTTWDTQIKEFTNVAREVTRRRAEKFIPIRIRTKHAATRERLQYLKSFRTSHEQLQSTINTVLLPQKVLAADGGVADHNESSVVDAVEELKEAYAELRDVDMLDISPEGTEIWNAAERAYNERTSRIEDSIIVKLRDRLATAKTANEMFRVFSRFNALFIRPKIRSAIQEYQAQLIDSVKSDIQSLHNRFIEQYPKSEAYKMAVLRDIPPISGAIIWVRQIERQLNLYMKRVEDVLGKGWELYSEGEKLHNESSTFRKKLESKSIFDSWLRDVTERKLSVSGRLFSVIRNRAASNRLELSINFDPQVIALFKEVRNLTYLKFQVPHAITSISKEAKRVYPYAMGLTDTLRIYTQTCLLIADFGDSTVLMNEYMNEVQERIAFGSKLNWESLVRSTYDLKLHSYPATENGAHENKQLQFFKDITISVSELERKAKILDESHRSIENYLKSIENCEYEFVVFNNTIQAIQSLIDKLNLENFSNLDYFVIKLNRRIRYILLLRLQTAISQWIQKFKSAESIVSRAMTEHRSDVITLEVIIKNQTISLSPPLQYARSIWYAQFQDCLGVVCRLPKLDSSRYELKYDISTDQATDSMFSELPSKAPADLQEAYNTIEEKLSEVRVYTTQWLRFQSLWDLQPEKVYAALGTDLIKWADILQDIRKVRMTFDTAVAQRDFGNIIIDYEQVQMRINAKYDTWQHDILVRFAEILNQNIQDMYSDLEKTRKELEIQTLDMSSTKRAVAFVSLVQSATAKVESFADSIDRFRKGQISLSRNRYQFPHDWIFIDQIDGEWSAFREVLAHKRKIMDDKLVYEKFTDDKDDLCSKIFAENKLVLEHIERAVLAWNSEKPVTGTIALDAAFAVLEKFDRQFTSLKTEQELILRAKDALDIDLPTTNFLESAIQEVEDFKSVWVALSSIWKAINDLRETPWASVVPHRVTQKIEELMATTKEMPSRMRQYSSFEYVQNVLRQFLKSHTLLADLKSEVMRERHWEKLFKTLRPKVNFHLGTLTLGNVWDFDLHRNESAITDILAQARGEMVLEDFLKQVRETWMSYHFDLVNYQNKCRLIRGWDELFEKCNEHMNSLGAMHHSPYFRQFEDDAYGWEDKLGRLNLLLDSWIDVQRQWVYLEGVFNGNAEIKSLLPVESARFHNLNAEFCALMRKVAVNSNVIDVLGIPGIQVTLERLADLLSSIQKALGQYLERERAQFPRYYFVGDEDLLEIIGNAKDHVRIQKHLKKMFAGISELVFDEENSTITGVISREGEVLELKQPISLIKTPKVNDWLRALELSTQESLASYVVDAVTEYEKVLTLDTLTAEQLIAWIQRYPAQVVILSSQIVWTARTETALATDSSALHGIAANEIHLLNLLATVVLQEIDRIDRKKCEGLITELVHQRNVIHKLISEEVTSKDDFNWLSSMKFMYSYHENVTERVHVQIGTADFKYGFEYIGVPDRLVQTPLTDKSFLALTGGLEQCLGGSPFGPAGTGKTETVKALGVQLGRFVLVFNCDDTFNFQSMGRIFLGICQVGAWGCFDEFNRLDEKILSAVSSQIQSIQLGLRASKLNHQDEIELIGKRFSINRDTGIFITLNPGYAGRSNLPDNLKKLFRSISMSRPDKELITEVVLYSQGFIDARNLSIKIVPFFENLVARLSSQFHYDFGLRALKSVLVTSGELKRRQFLQNTEFKTTQRSEDEIIVQSLRETIAPKLVGNDEEEFLKIEEGMFPGVKYFAEDLASLRENIVAVAEAQGLVVNDKWLTKATQLYQIQTIHHGVMMVGDSGSGKSTVWKTLLKALQELDGRECITYIVDSKVMSKENLFGSLDVTTREWNDGLFTSILRKVNEDLRGESLRRHWIVFDCDVDPEWAENLNSVLDDNKILTLPNGERLALPDNVRILFEVDSMKYATLATVSRCGMVWFGSNTVSTSMLAQSYLRKLFSGGFDDRDDNLVDAFSTGKVNDLVMALTQQLEGLLLTGSWIDDALSEASRYSHIMEFSSKRATQTLLSLITASVKEITEYELQHSDFALSKDQRKTFLLQKILLSVIWSCVGDCPLREREEFARTVCRFELFSVLELPEDSVLDYTTSLPLAKWIPWQSHVPHMELDPHMVTATDLVIPTVDTARHEALLYACLQEQRCMILCGPPGSGKTMTLFNTLRKFANMEVVGLNFSSATSPDLIIKTFEQHCDYRKTHTGFVLEPKLVARRLVIFCDEINLPAPDKYCTQRAISFLRQLIEQNGFWRLSDKSWVSLNRIQFVGACNPPTDAGRTALGQRFLRHASLIMIDYPGEVSLRQIYGTFNAAVLKSVPSLRGYCDALTSAMVDFYISSQRKFTAAEHSHYVYSPRELTRWVRGVYETVQPLSSLSLEGLVRIWAHEATRLFSDRLVTEIEREWTQEEIRQVARRNFLNINETEALQGPILFSNWLTKNYAPVALKELREFINARMKTFCEEELDVPLVLYDDAIDHVLRIDRVFRQPQGHLILIGVSGSGKSTLTRFVAWMNGLRVFQINAHKKYTTEDFEDDLRDVLRRTGCKGQKMCFILDESNVLESGFLERMNTLLANAEIPGLFEGDDYSSLLSACRDGARQQGLLLDSQDELYNWFRSQVVRNLHVVFTMNPPREGLSAKAATSPALFNRCVLNWMGDWSETSLVQVASELTKSMDLDLPSYVPASSAKTHREAVVRCMIHVHLTMRTINEKYEAQLHKINLTTPRHFLDYVSQFEKTFREKCDELEDQQRHLNVGLEKLQDTVEKVRHLRTGLTEKQELLRTKSALANDKLQQMVVDQNETERRRAESLEIQAELAIKEQEIKRRQKLVLDDLAKAEPAVLEAKENVNNIKKQHLTEVRSMANPPEAVKMAMEAVCTLLGYKVDNWRAVQSIIRRDDFISSIVNFSTDTQMPRGLRNRIQAEYLSRPNFNFETVNRASKACGPLILWLEAQVNYSFILEQIGPLREEVAMLTADAETTRAQVAEMVAVIEELEESIAQYKEEYAVLISDVQEIKSEMAKVEYKVNRSVKLLGSLAAERERWRLESKSFEEQTSTLAGDALLAAAVLVYGGFFDQQYRQLMQREWQDYLQSMNIAFKRHNSASEYLSTMSERAAWQDMGLPVGDLYVENALMLERSNRYPLIIDPSGRTIEFLRKRYGSLVVTSFLDGAFVKQLESALRFGNPVLVTDAEHFDPILNHVLNKEYQRIGGRVLIQLARQEIDFSSNFKLFLSTRDAGAVFSPDVISRTTLVNFTVTRSNLTAQSLDELLKVLRPDIDRKRSNLMHLRTEFNLHLRQLERGLLSALSESEGNILDDDNVVMTLENLKVQAADVTEKMEETEGVMTKIDEMTAQYSVVAETSSTIYAILELLPNLDRYYQFSLGFFQGIFTSVLGMEFKESELSVRLNEIVCQLYAETYRRTSLGLRHSHSLVLASFFAYAVLKKCDISMLADLFDSEVQRVDLSAPSYLVPQLVAHVKESTLFRRYRITDERSLEEFLASEDDDAELVRLMLLRLARSGQYVSRATAFISRALPLRPASVDLPAILEAEVSASMPVVLCCAPGHDASGKIEQLAVDTRTKCTAIALGSAESIVAADRAIAEAADGGGWVLLKNVHLSVEYASLLEKRLRVLRVHSKFRLVASMETTGSVPVSLLRASRVLMFEAATGLRASMKETMALLSRERICAPPAERAKLYLACSWLHAVVLERLRYGVAGWRKSYDFRDADFEFTVGAFDRILARCAGERSNVDPASLPWRVFQELLATVIYGGKVDDEADLSTLMEITQRVVSAGVYDYDFNIAGAVPGVRVPEGNSAEAFTEWIEQLPEHEPVEWLGLPESSERTE